MSYAYNRRKKNKWLRGELMIRYGELPPPLSDTPDHLSIDQLLEVWKARRHLKAMIRKHIRKGTQSRFVLAKDNQGKPLYRGIYKSKDGQTHIVSGQFLPQRDIEYEMRRAFTDQRKA